MILKDVLFLLLFMEEILESSRPLPSYLYVVFSINMNYSMMVHASVLEKINFCLNILSSSFEPDVLCSVSVITLQHRSCSVCMSFVR